MASSPRPDKIMSSRLMTMKFMQRAVASSSSATTAKPHDSDSQLSKQQKVSAPLGMVAPPSELQVVRAALDAEEAKRSEAAARQQGADAGETRWVLSFVNRAGGDYEGGGEERGLRVQMAGYAEIDNGNGHVQGEWVPTGAGRRSFGSFNREVEKSQKARDDQASSSVQKASGADSEDESGEDNSDLAGVGDLIRTTRDEAVQLTKASRHDEARSLDVERNAKRWKRKEIKLNKLSSISGGGANGGTNGAGGIKNRVANRNMECFGCREKGHARKDCPQMLNSKRKGERSEHGSAKRLRRSLESSKY